jgi:hypothetical protein
MSSGRFEKGNTSAMKYKAEYCQAMIDYFNDDDGYPTFELFAASIGVDRDTLLNWTVDHDRFRHAYAKCKSIQLGKTISGAMCRKYDSNFAKFICSACHGLKETTATDTKVKFVVDLPEEVDEEAN